MADERAIAAVSDGILHLLESAYTEDAPYLHLGNLKVNFAVYNATEFVKHELVKTGVTVFPYRALPNLSHRTPPGRIMPNGHRERTILPLDLHLLLTAWGDNPQTQNILLGWMMRTLEDYPTIPARILNQKYPNCFEADEAVDLVISEMRLEDLLTLWERLSDGQKAYQISVPYLARAVLIQSRREVAGRGDVQARVTDIGILEGAGI